VLYEELRFESNSGLNEAIQISKSGNANPLQDALQSLVVSAPGQAASH
jgi:hypothetical protein